ncbi:hypothetical protein PXH59_00565 (plasmid) [Xenorhabdus sp. SF857]|uniref:hypothetical protein n=1 Tax=Xenorhabdus bakwenae TaxID=3026967 RepID=UPI0025581C6C|nr:hypothetical protein [Xenorhabdus sp. SF857]WFQ78171.1 hypothetical protein PXH59_00565 [Xenorhabdus sp. SF857]
MTEEQLTNLVKAGNVLADRTSIRALKSTSRKSIKAVSTMHSRNREPSGLEISFSLQIKKAGLPMPLWGKDELQFHPNRRWRFDFAWMEQKIAVEVEGGTYNHGKEKYDSYSGKKITQKSRHLTPTGFHDDCIKYGEAAILGWCVIRVDAKMVKDGSALAMLESALRSKISI